LAAGVGLADTARAIGAVFQRYATKDSLSEATEQDRLDAERPLKRADGERPRTTATFSSKRPDPGVLKADGAD